MAADRYRPARVSARVATVRDLPMVTETLAAAFYDDPVWSWAFPDAAHRLEQHRAVWGLILESLLEHHWVWLTEGGGAASMWVPPGRTELGPEDERRLEELLDELLGDGAARVSETFLRFEAAHPRERDHYYLSLLGTHPDHRGDGLGMGLLADNLSGIDAEGAPAFLESSNPANDHRYERLHFVRCGSFELGEDGPSVAQMWREPRQVG
jgi:GNAT superfamily N-acetyltransferase